MKRYLLIALAVLALAGLLWLGLTGGGRRADGAGGAASAAGGKTAESGRASSRQSDDGATRAEEPRGRGASGEASRDRVRRFKDRAAREKLLAFVAAARARRESRSAGGSGEAGELTKDVIRSGVEAIIEDVKKCYLEALEKKPALGGDLVVEFEIVGEPDAGGAVDTAEISDLTDDALRDDAELTECMIDAIYSIELPSPPSGGRVRVSYPFTLQPD